MLSFRLLFKLQAYLALFILVYSCKPQKLIYDKKKDAVFIPNNSVFDTAIDSKRYLSYFDPFTLEWANIEFKKDEQLPVKINSPTFFLNYSPFLVYPGDSIEVNLINGYQLDLKNKNNEQRNKEFSFLKDFSSSWGAKEDDFRSRGNNAELNNSNNFYRYLQENQVLYNLKINLLDSLLADNRLVDNAFGKNVRMFYEPDSLNKIVSVYEFYHDSLKKKNVYTQKYKELLPLINSLKSEEHIQHGYFLTVEKIADALLPKKIYRINNHLEFKSCFDTASFLFHGIAKEYILTKIIFAAHRKKISISKSDEENYYYECKTKAYTAIVQNLFSEQKKNNKAAAKHGSNALFDFTTSETTSLDKVIKDNAGKLIVIDFWASWCVPCLQEIPYEKKNQEYFSEKEVIFLNISIDTEMPKWRNAITTNNMNSKYNYVFVNFRESDFVKTHNVELIPRYMIFGKDSKLITDDAPRPSDSKLKELIEKVLSQ